VYDLVIEDATIVSGQGRVVADIGIRKGKIAFVGARAPGRAKLKISAIGKFIMPGIVDMGVRLGAPGLTAAECWETETRAAVSSGVTTLIELPDSVPLSRTAKSISSKRKLAREHSRANFGFWAQATSKNLDKLTTLREKGVLGIWIDLAAKDDGALTRPQLVDLLGSYKGVISIMAEDPALLADAHRTFAGEADPLDNQVHPPEAASRGVEYVLELVKETGRAIHLMGLSTAAELHLLDPLRGDLPISVGTSPNHLFLNCENPGDFKHRPPLREELDRRSLWTALKRQRIDAIASHHTGYTKEELVGNYWERNVGLPGLETSFPLMMAAVHHGRAGLERMVELLSEGPASIMGLSKKGAIKRGYDADLLLFTEGQLEVLEREHLIGRSGWSPFVGRELAGKPEFVLVGGEIVAKRGKITNDNVRGKEVTTLK
jgi:dihydroorotase